MTVPVAVGRCRLTIRLCSAGRFVVKKNKRNHFSWMFLFLIYLVWCFSEGWVFTLLWLLSVWYCSSVLDAWEWGGVGFRWKKLPVVVLFLLLQILCWKQKRRWWQTEECGVPKQTHVFLLAHFVPKIKAAIITSRPNKTCRNFVIFGFALGGRLESSPARHTWVASAPLLCFCTNSHILRISFSLRNSKLSCGCMFNVLLQTLFYFYSKSSLWFDGGGPVPPPSMVYKYSKLLCELVYGGAVECWALWEIKQNRTRNVDERYYCDFFFCRRWDREKSRDTRTMLAIILFKTLEIFGSTGLARRGRLVDKLQISVGVHGWTHARFDIYRPWSTVSTLS